MEAPKQNPSCSLSLLQKARTLEESITYLNAQALQTSNQPFQFPPNSQL